MRCKNCGWENPANKAKCEKCNTSFVDAMFEASRHTSSAFFSSDDSEPHKTVDGCPECGYPIKRLEKNCPRCGHPLSNIKQDTPVNMELLPANEQLLSSDHTPEIFEPTARNCTFCNTSVSETAHFCPNCGVSLTNKHQTMMPWIVTEEIQAPECSLTAIAREGEPKNDTTLRYSGKIIQLSRGNTEPGNQTITSKIQAELNFEDDIWYLQDKSDLKTTYIYAGEKIALKAGDIIVLGNRSYVFNCDSKSLIE